MSGATGGYGYPPRQPQGGYPQQGAPQGWNGQNVPRHGMQGTPPDGNVGGWAANASGSPQGAEMYTNLGGPTGNVYQDQWLAERTPQQLAYLRAAARKAGKELAPTTILRPILIPSKQKVYNLGYSATLAAASTFTMQFYFPFYAFIQKVTATAVGVDITLPANQSTEFLGTVRPTDYIDAKLIRTNHDEIITQEMPLSEWAGDARLEYVFNLIPFVAQSETLIIQGTAKRLLSADGEVAVEVNNIAELNITLHCMRYPDVGGT